MKASVAQAGHWIQASQGNGAKCYCVLASRLRIILLYLMMRTRTMAAAKRISRGSPLPNGPCCVTVLASSCLVSTLQQFFKLIDVPIHCFVINN